MHFSFVINTEARDHCNKTQACHLCSGDVVRLQGPAEDARKSEDTRKKSSWRANETERHACPEVLASAAACGRMMPNDKQQSAPKADSVTSLSLTFQMSLHHQIGRTIQQKWAQIHLPTSVRTSPIQNLMPFSRRTVGQTDTQFESR